MISRNGLIHHLNNIEHQAGIFARTASEVAHDSAQQSKAVILKNFDRIYRGSVLSPAARPVDENPGDLIARPPAADEKFCNHCENFIPLNNSHALEWHRTANCRRSAVDVMIELRAAPGYPARVEQFIDVQRSEEIPPKALEGYRIREVFSDSIGRLVVTYEK